MCSQMIRVFFPTCFAHLPFFSVHLSLFRNLKELTKKQMKSIYLLHTDIGSDANLLEKGSENCKSAENEWESWVGAFITLRCKDDSN